MARKKKEKKGKNTEGEELQEGKKGKKKLLLIPLALIVVAAVAAAVVLLVLPRFGINLLGGGTDEEELPKKGLETYTLDTEVEGEEEGEVLVDSTIALDVILEEGEGTLLTIRKPDPALKSEGSSDSASSSSAAVDPGVPTYTYIYDVPAPAAVVDRYLDAVLGGEEQFELIDDETYMPLEERPALADELGALTLARASVQDGHLFQLVIGWSEASTLTVRVSAPEGAIQRPEEDPNEGLGLGSQVIETIPLTEQIEKLKSLSPAQLGLAGDSMDAYEIFPVEGFVKVDGLDCRRFNVYERRSSGDGYYPDLAVIIMLSSDQKHIYYMDPVSNAVTEMR